MIRILLADKNQHDLDALRADLAATDMEVTTARDGREVVALALEQEPDAVVVSASLGQMGGFAVSRELKMLAGRGDIAEPRVVVLLERPHDSWLADWSSCDAHLTKPVDATELDRMLREPVSAHRGAAAP